jgi:formate hydrogenlyase subunit 6/NADH:ubiquinone oxidoreductase subunit I
MNQEKRQELRDKHAKKQGKTYCRHCFDAFPCDAIQMLNKMEEREATIVQLRTKLSELLDDEPTTVVS